MTKIYQKVYNNVVLDPEKTVAQEEDAVSSIEISHMKGEQTKFSFAVSYTD